MPQVMLQHVYSLHFTNHHMALYNIKDLGLDAQVWWSENETETSANPPCTQGTRKIGFDNSPGFVIR